MEMVPAGKDLPKDENTLADPAWGRDERIELVRIGPKFFQTEKGKPFAKAAVQRSRAALDDPAFKGPLDLRGADAASVRLGRQLRLEPAPHAVGVWGGLKGLNHVLAL